MLVKFKNDSVPIYMLRQGTVVMLEESLHGGHEQYFYHIRAFDIVNNGVAYLTLDNVWGDEPVSSELLTWLSPL